MENQGEQKNQDQSGVLTKDKLAPCDLERRFAALRAANVFYRLFVEYRVGTVIA